MNQIPLESVQSEANHIESMAPSSSAETHHRSLRRRRSRRARIGRFFGIVGGLYISSGVVGMGWLMSLFLPFLPGQLPPKMMLFFLFMPPIVVWYVVSGILLFKGISWSLRAATYTISAIVVFDVLLLYNIPSLVQIPTIVLIIFNLVLLCLVVDSRIKRNFQRIEHHNRRRHRR